MQLNTLADIEQGPSNARDANNEAALHIPVPNGLLAGLNTRQHWTPRGITHASGSISHHAEFDAVSIAKQQSGAAQQKLTRGNSITIGGLVRSRAIGFDTKRGNEFAISGPRAPLRKTSLITIEEAQQLISTRGSDANLSVDPPRHSSIHNAILFHKLSDYSLSNPRSAMRRTNSGEEADPLNATAAPILASAEANDQLVPRIDNLEGDKIEDTTPYRLQQASAGQVVARAASVTVKAVQEVANAAQEVMRRSSLNEVYEKAKSATQKLQRKKWVQLLFEYSVYLLIVCFVYFVLVGVPLWKGAVYWLYWLVDHKFFVPGTWSITIGLAVIYAYGPLLMLFEKEPDINRTAVVHNTALLIPCYKSAKIIGPTLEAALKIFPAQNIYVVANGNSPTPLDDTENVCRLFGVNHIWSPIGSKIVAQFVGCYAAKNFENVLLIDDDCALPPNFPVVSDRLKGRVKCIGYTIKSVGPSSSKGTFCQQAQDLEYKISGLQRAFAGAIGSATFPHGAISLWNTAFLIKTFHTHPGFSVSEDWFFGHVARQLGCRIKMCTAVFVETETPAALFFSSDAARGGFGEMTVFKQRFYRWNFFFVNGLYYNMKYIVMSWKLGWWELGAKLFVFQEVCETLLYLLAPFVLPISLVVRPAFCAYLLAGTLGLYYLNVTIFNEVHLHLRGERVGYAALYLYYTPYKLALTVINVFSCYYSLFKYASYFAKKHPKVIEDEKAVEVILRLEENESSTGVARRMTVTAVGTRLDSVGGLSVVVDTPGVR